MPPKKACLAPPSKGASGEAAGETHSSQGATPGDNFLNTDMTFDYRKFF